MRKPIPKRGGGRRKRLPGCRLKRCSHSIKVRRPFCTTAATLKASLSALTRLTPSWLRQEVKRRSAVTHHLTHHLLWEEALSSIMQLALETFDWMSDVCPISSQILHFFFAMKRKRFLWGFVVAVRRGDSSVWHANEKTTRGVKPTNSLGDFEDPQ